MHRLPLLIVLTTLAASPAAARPPKAQPPEDASVAALEPPAARPPAAQVAAGAAGEEPSSIGFTLGLAYAYHSHVLVPSGREAADVTLAGVVWRARLEDWLQLGGGLYAGADVAAIGADTASIRLELISGMVELAVLPWLHPSFRLGLGWQSGTLRESSSAGAPYRATGAFAVAAPGVQLRPLPWLQIHLEAQTTLFTGGEPDGGAALQLGGELGIGFSL